jgi:hypothetical protein
LLSSTGGRAVILPGALVLGVVGKFFIASTETVKAVAGMARAALPGSFVDVASSASRWTRSLRSECV